MEIVIENMKSNDLEEVIKIYSEAIAEGKSTFERVTPTVAVWDKAHLDAGRLVAKDEDKVVGWCALSATSSRKALQGVVEISIYIDKDYRGQKIGEKLLEKAIPLGENAGYWSFYVAIFEDNKASVKLFEKSGFRKVGYREKMAKDRFDVWQNVIIMEKRSKNLE